MERIWNWNLSIYPIKWNSMVEFSKRFGIPIVRWSKIYCEIFSKFGWTIQELLKKWLAIKILKFECPKFF